MSWTTDLAKLRSVLGDTSDLKQVFGDPYLNAMLEEYGSVGKAAITALERLQNDPDMMRQKYSGLGKFGINELIALRRSISEQIKEIKDGHMSAVATSSTDARFPDADVDRVGGATDEDGWNIEGSVDQYIVDLDTKIR